MVLYVALVMIPAVLLAVLLYAPRAGLALLVFLAVAVPLAVVFSPSPVKTEQVVERHTSNPGGDWSRAECRGRGGVLLLMMDNRKQSPIRWWVKCRDGSKAGVVGHMERPKVWQYRAPLDERLSA